MSKKTTPAEESFDGFNLLMNTIKPGIPEVKTEETEETEEETSETATIETPEVPEVTKPETVETPEASEEVDEEDEQGTSPFIAMAEFLGEKGIVEFDPEKFDDSESGLEELVQGSIAKGIEEYKNSLATDEAKAFLEYLENGGDPRRYIESQATVDYAALDLENENVQKAILRDYLKIQDYTDVEIEETLQDYEDSGIMEKQAARAKTKMVSYQEQHKTQILVEQKEQAKRQRAAQEQQINDLHKTIETIDNIAGISLDKTTRTRLFDHITKPVDRKTGKTQLMINFEKDPNVQLKMAYLDMIGWDLSKLEKKVESKVASKIKASLNNYTDSSKRLKGTSITEKEAKNSDAEFSAFKTLFKK